MRKEVIGDCTLYLGDCRDIIPTLDVKVDALISDPPYGIEDLVNGYGRGGKTIQNDKTLDAFLQMVGVASARFPDIWMMCFYSCRVTDKIFSADLPVEYYGEVIWDKKVPGMGGSFRYQHENVAIFKNGAPKGIGEGFSVISHIRTPDLHPHQKPIPVMQKLIKLSGGTSIIDPFMGSGSTGVACAKMGVAFTGIEVDPNYFDIACKRIEEAYQQQDMFVECAKAEQVNFFDAIETAELPRAEVAKA